MYSKSGKKPTKNNSSKTLREFSSGGVVYKKINSSENQELQTLWLVTASMPSDIFPEVVWRLPKGWIDDQGEGIPGPIASGEVKADEKSLQDTAIREVREESGVSAKIVTKIGTEKYFYKHPLRGQILKFVTFYLMEWVEDLPEGFDGETSEVVWLPLESAVKKLSFPGERKILQKAGEILSTRP
jgi:8-oxo-dGTP pyrophosphatase MutT (NUDIX family)